MLNFTLFPDLSLKLMADVLEVDQCQVCQVLFAIFVLYHLVPTKTTCSFLVPRWRKTQRIVSSSSSKGPKVEDSSSTPAFENFFQCLHEFLETLRKALQLRHSKWRQPKHWSTFCCCNMLQCMMKWWNWIVEDPRCFQPLVSTPGLARNRTCQSEKHRQ